MFTTPQDASEFPT